MERFRICYVKKAINDSWECDITHVGGIDESGKNWNTSIEEAIEGITAGVWEFYLVENLEEIQVNICTLDGSENFLSAKGQGYLHNLLEDLPECGLAFQL